MPLGRCLILQVLFADSKNAAGVALTSRVSKVLRFGIHGQLQLFTRDVEVP